MSGASTRGAVAAGPARRIIPLAPSVTEVLFALGAGDRVVARTQSSNYPPAAARLPHVGDLVLDYDRIVMLAPDLVVAESITRDDDVRRLRSLGLRVVQVHSATLDGYRETLRTLGDLTGCAAEARRRIQALDAAMGDLRRRSASHPIATRPRVFVEIWDRPLMTAGRGTFIDDMVGLVGGVNICADLRGAYPQIDPELLVRRDPQVVVLTTSTVEGFTTRPGFSHLQAVRQRRVYAIDPDRFVRPTPRLVEGLRQLAGWLDDSRLPSAVPR